MALSNAAQRSYLEVRRTALIALQAAAQQQAATARSQAADLTPSRACRRELMRLRQLALTAQARSDQLARAIRVIDVELEGDEQ